LDGVGCLNVTEKLDKLAIARGDMEEKEQEKRVIKTR